MSQIDLIRAEIERRLSYYHPENANHGLASGFREDGKAIAYKELLSFLDTLKEQPVELDDAINNWQGKEAFPEGCGITPLPKAMEIVDKTARHFYELGRQSKEQPLLPGFENEQPGIPGKDFVPVAWCDALEQYGIWRIVRVEQPVCEELEEEIEKSIPLPYGFLEVEHSNMESVYSREQMKTIASHFAKWQKEQDDKELSEKIASAYQLGLADKEKQMMKEAVEGKVIKTDKHTSVRYESFYGTRRYFYGIANKQFKPGDKVRIIIVKED